jgi:hypothetical protein
VFAADEIEKLKIMKPKHTPGPWSLSDAGPNSGNIIRMEVCGPDAHRVCEIEDSTIDAAKTMKRKAAQRDEANARLIQSAPDLLSALVMAQHIIHEQANCVDTKYDNAMAAISAAIKKASGEA